jgi:hypothetical protein
MSREATIKVLMMMDEGLLDAAKMAQDLLGYLSEDEVKDFCMSNDIDLDLEDEDDEDNTCSLCQGTGIGQYGDPDTSRCSDCGGSGVCHGTLDDEYDGQPDEAQEWHDFDPDC